jgi:hypothetical protein
VIFLTGLAQENSGKFVPSELPEITQHGAQSPAERPALKPTSSAPAATKLESKWDAINRLNRRHVKGAAVHIPVSHTFNDDMIIF